MKNTPKRKTKTYSDEFKKDTVDLILTSGKTLTQIGRELGVSTNTLFTWKQKALKESGSKSSSGELNTPEVSKEDLFKEIQELRKENQTLRRQREILKKAASILAEDPQLGMR